MARPDLSTVAYVHLECDQFVMRAKAILASARVDGHDQTSLMRCVTCSAVKHFPRGAGAPCAPRRARAATAEEVIHPLGDGCRGRATARLGTVCQEPVARLLRVAGRHAERLHDPHGRDLRPMALACDAQWRGVKNSKNAVPIMHGVQRATGGRRPPWPLTARGWWP